MKLELSKLSEFLPFSIVAKTTSVCPNLAYDLYGVRNINKNRHIQQLIKTKYVSFDYEKYCNNDDFINFTYENNSPKVACARMKTIRKMKRKNTLKILIFKICFNLIFFLSKSTQSLGANLK